MASTTNITNNNNNNNSDIEHMLTIHYKPSSDYLESWKTFTLYLDHTPSQPISKTTLHRQSNYILMMDVRFAAQWIKTIKSIMVNDVVSFSQSSHEFWSISILFKNQDISDIFIPAQLGTYLSEHKVFAPRLIYHIEKHGPIHDGVLQVQYRGFQQPSPQKASDVFEARHQYAKQYMCKRFTAPVIKGSHVKHPTFIGRHIITPQHPQGEWVSLDWLPPSLQFNVSHQ